jgi:hypothetical protein
MGSAKGMKPLVATTSRVRPVRIAKALGVIVVTALAAGAGFVACASPVEDDLIAALGPEAEGESEDEFHRYGQPCLACHGGYGEGEPVFSFGGTVFAQPDELITVAGAKVTITDAIGEKTTMTSNCAGNFFVEESKYKPVYPVRVEVTCTSPAGFDGVTTTYRSVMGTRVNREGSCAACHANNVADQNGPGRVFCMDGRLPNPWTVDPECGGGPKLEDLGGASAAAGSSVASSAAASSSGGEE